MGEPAPQPACLTESDPDDPDPSGRTAHLWIDDTTGQLPQAKLDELARMGQRAIDAARTTPGAGGEVRVRLLDDSAMSSAHAQHLGDPTVTDVITFDLTAGAAAASGAPLDVDLMVCIDEARRQAMARGLVLEHELLLYIVHGVLHCLGYDDSNELEAARMHAREDEILTAIGAGAAYAPQPPGRSPE